MGRASEYGGGAEDENGYTFGGAKKPAPQPQRPSAPVRFGNVGVKPAAPQSKDVSKFEVGVKVKHPRFGVGVITATRGSANNLIVTVKFEVAGNKDLAAVLAPLEMMD